MFVIGLTGGIGTGKSEVRRALEELGAVVVDADQVGHEAYRPHSETWRVVVQAFGTAILNADSTVNRKSLGAIVFRDPEALSKLNSIMYPQMGRMIQQRLSDLREQGVRVAVVEAAVLIEAGWDRLADETWVVHAPEEVVVQRVAARSGLSPDEVRRRIRSQISQDERKAHAHALIENAGSREALREQVKTLWEQRVMTQIRGKR